jgi:uncharacterized protein YabN with tetrapyrrole methylase and pyrophosphatase domain
MKITWLGQAGLMFETENKIILVDPYLSDNVKNFEPKNYRRVAIDERFLKINPEFALTKAIKKFINRFEYIEKSALFQGKNLSDMTLEEMDLLWDEAKIALRPKK